MGSKGGMDKLDRLWSKCIKKRAGGRCELCGRQGNEAHHLFKRQYKSVRWDLENGIYLCAGVGSCHSLAHSKRAEFAEWIIRRKGKEWYDELERRKNTIMKPDREKIEVELREYLNNERGQG